MRLFPPRQRAEQIESEHIVHLLWRYEVSEDGGESWRPEVDGDERSPDVLRRGNWVAPPLN